MSTSTATRIKAAKSARSSVKTTSCFVGKSRMFVQRPRFAAFFFSCLVIAAGPAAAQYPDRPIRLIAPQAAGSPTDNFARLLSPELGNRLGQPIVVENLPGGALTIGIDAVAKAAPDGYTLGVGPVG